MANESRFKLLFNRRAKKPYQAVVIGPQGGVRSLGSFATEDEGEHALYIAIEAEVCRPVRKKREGTPGSRPGSGR